MFSLVDWLTEQVEEGFFAILDALVVAELNSRGLDHFGSHFVEVSFEPESDLFEFFEIIGSLDVFHDLHDLGFLGSGIEDSLL